MSQRDGRISESKVETQVPEVGNFVMFFSFLMLCYMNLKRASDIAHDFSRVSLFH